jgi:3-isopropylmalate/(R)-2-methylmalate dehydratase large subunit
MGMTLAEKILAAHCGEKEVHPGQFINARVDIVMASELSGIVASRSSRRSRARASSIRKRSCS